MADLLVRATSEQDLDDLVEAGWSIINCTAGWIGTLHEDDELGDLEFRLIAPSASTEELQALWERVQRGEAAKEAHRAVNGPSYRYWERRRREGPHSDEGDGEAA